MHSMSVLFSQRYALHSSIFYRCTRRFHRRFTSSCKPTVQSIDIKTLVKRHQYPRAWGTFYQKLRYNAATLEDCNAILPACYSSDQMREFIHETMPSVKLPPNTSSMNILVERLLLEGNENGAKAVIDEEMPMCGVLPNSITESFVKYIEFGDTGVKSLQTIDSHKLGIMRSKLLKHWLRQSQGEYLDAAWSLFGCLIDTKCLHDRHLNIMMKTCMDANLMKRMMFSQHIETCGIIPSIACYNTLINRLLLEGDTIGAKNILENDMMKANIKPDRITNDMMKANIKPDRITEYLFLEDGKSMECKEGKSMECKEGKSMECKEGKSMECKEGKSMEFKRIGLLKTMLNSSYNHVDGFTTAWALFKKLCDKNVVRRSHVHVMLELGCLSSSHQRSFITMVANKMNIIPDKKEYEYVLNMLFLEGRSQEQSYDIITTEALKTNTDISDISSNVLKVDHDALQKKRMHVLLRLLHFSSDGNFPFSMTPISNSSSGAFDTSRVNNGVKSAVQFIERFPLTQDACANAALYSAVINHICNPHKFESKGALIKRKILGNNNIHNEKKTLWNSILDDAGLSLMLYRECMYNNNGQMMHIYAGNCDESNSGVIIFPLDSSKSKQPNLLRISMHGASRAVAFVKMSDVLIQIRNKYLMRGSVEESLAIIVGKGHNSGTTRGRVTNAVKYMSRGNNLQEALVSFLDKTTEPLLEAQINPNNTGELLLSAKQLQDWCEGNQAKEWSLIDKQVCLNLERRDRQREKTTVIIQGLGSLPASMFDTTISNQVKEFVFGLLTQRSINKDPIDDSVECSRKSSGILELRVPTNKKGRFRGRVYAVFDTSANAHAAVISANESIACLIDGTADVSCLDLVPSSVSDVSKISISHSLISNEKAKLNVLKMRNQQTRDFSRS